MATQPLTALEQAIGTPWFITPMPKSKLRMIPNPKITGMWRIRNAESGDHYVVTRRQPGDGNGNGGHEWDCGCCETDCVHIEAVRLYAAGKLRAPVEPGFERLVGLNCQGQAGEDTQTSAPQGEKRGDTQMSWKDRTYEHADETVSYPFVQWVNDGSSLDPRADKGGFACPVEQAVPIPGTLANIHHRNGDTTEVIFTQELTVAVLKTRFAWIKDGLRQSSYTDGARGKLQALCVVQGSDGRPVSELVMLTFTGVVSRQFSSARRAFSGAVRKATKGKAPAYAFWMTLRAGEVELVGSTKQSPITTIELAGEVDADRDFVGDVVLDSVPWPEVKEWANGWKSPGINGTGVIEGADGGEVQPQPSASQAQDAPQEGTSEWAKRFPLPFDGSTVKAGTPLGDLSENALKFLVSKESKYPDAAKAARILLRAAEEVAQEEGIPF